MAVEASRALGDALPRLAASPRDPRRAATALYGAWLCGTVLGTVGMALHHKLCHVLGGSFDLPHAETHAVVLPHAVAYNAAAARRGARAGRRGARRRRAAPAGSATSPATLGAPRRCATSASPRPTSTARPISRVPNPYWNPRPIERDAIRALLQRAWAGDRPA